MRTVLLASLGLSPAVITETIWAMMHPPAGAAASAPDLVHVVTTQPRGAEALAGLRARIRERIGMLCAQFGHPVPEIVVEAVADPDAGGFIVDVSTQRENILFAGRITALVHQYAQEADTRIHMSLAGGRKSMSSYAHTAMMFFGRVQDELTHVLVDPPELEFCGDTFWWPGQPFQASRPDGFDEQGRPRRKPVDSAIGKARVELVTVPFVRLGVFLPEGARIEDADYARLVEYIAFERAGGKVTVDLATRTVTAGTESVRLPPTQFPVFALLAIARAEGWPGEGWVPLRAFTVGQHDDGQVNAGPEITLLEELFKAQERPPDEPEWWRNEFENDPEEPTRLRGPSLIERVNVYNGTGPNPVQPVLSKIVDELRQQAKSPFVRALVTPTSRRKGRISEWGITLPPERIVLRGFGDGFLGQHPQATRKAMTA